MKICAIVSSYNESDVLEESIQALIREGVDVFVLDNHSSDNSLDIAKRYLGRGVVGFESIRFEEAGRDIYNWAGILKRKTELAQTLGYDWYLHTDADEIRQSPWEGVSLAQAIARVDQEGYNLINFKLFNFRLYEGMPMTGDLHQRMQHYSNAENYNAQQLKAWKHDPSVDLSTYGGHWAVVPNPKVFPTRFILRHYPIRSLEQGVRKINNERKARYSQEDRKRSWHVQYDHFSTAEDRLQAELLWPVSTLTLFDLAQERISLAKEPVTAAHWMQGENDRLFKPRTSTDYADYLRKHHTNNTSNEAIAEMVDTFIDIVLSEQELGIDADELDEQAAQALTHTLRLEAALRYREGKPQLLEVLMAES